MPTSVTKRSPGKPAMMAVDDMPTKIVPMTKAMAKASAPMLIGSAVVTMNITTSPRIEAVCGDIGAFPSGKYSQAYQLCFGWAFSSLPSRRVRA